MRLDCSLLCLILLLFLSGIASASPASAEIKERYLTLESNGSTSFPRLIEEAEKLAQEAINREFIGNPQLTILKIIILGERHGQVVPLLRTTVSREAWFRKPQIEEWTRYFTDSQFLLGFRASIYSKSRPIASPPITVDLPSPKRRLEVQNDPGFRDD